MYLLTIHLVIFLTIFLILHRINGTEHFTKKLEFSLYNVDNELLKNTNWEYSEQLLLEKYVKKSDNVLQLGGNIGASCILLDKILNKTSNNICVEPNSKVIKTLYKNKKLNKCKFNILYGVISDKTDLKLTNDGENESLNFYGSRITKDGTESVKSFPLRSIKNINTVNVLFADCEGCLEQFLDEYESFLEQLRLVIYEQDQTHLCDYDKIKRKLEENGFKMIEHSGQNIVWEK